MATRARHEAPVLYSVLDRLINRSIDNPDERVNPTRAESIRFFKDSVRRDLEWLLNTRTPLQPPKGKESERSLYTFGLPDITSLSLLSLRDRQALTKAIQAAIARFEPRIAHPKVVLVTANDQRLERLRFIIEGVLLMEPNPEPIAFDTVLDLSSGEYKLPGDTSAR
jgi:type VI secretion system protein ImpF